jgi:Ca2+-binding EF-hand superfamily protein
MATTTSALHKVKSASEVKPLKRPVQEVRTEIRSYIRNERDTVLKRWMALKETIHSEDIRRDQFYQRKFVEDTKALPLNVLKFIGTLKKAVRATIRDKGGTAYSIIRALFIYWDADRSGLISANELLACMRSLGVKISLDECTEIVLYYKPKATAAQQQSTAIEMDYRELLLDIQRGEPTLIQFVTQEEDAAKDQKEIRFEQLSDHHIARPMIVDRFLEAVRTYLQTKMRNEGGTPQQHVRYLFSQYDYDYSNGLDPKELMAAVKKGMNLSISEEQAIVIVNYYDSKKAGQMTYDRFVKEVCADVKPILHFIELTSEEIKEKKKSLSKNPFIPKPFQSSPNKVLEQFKCDLRRILIARINKMGGSMASWIREAFSAWDRHFSGKINNPRILQGACKRLGLAISEDDARIIIKCYDRFNSNEMHYNYLIQEMMVEDAHFIADGSQKLGYNRFTNSFEKKLSIQQHQQQSPQPQTDGDRATAEGWTRDGDKEDTITPTSRTPSTVNILLTRIKRAITSFITKSKGKLSNPIDIIHGTFLRFDNSKTGKINSEVFRLVLNELKVSYDQSMINDTMTWFDSDGSHFLNYSLLIQQVFGNDIIMEPFHLPEYKEKMKYLKQQRRNQLQQLDNLRKCDNNITINQHENHAEGNNAEKLHPKQIQGLFKRKNLNSLAVSSLLSTIALNRTKTMANLPTNNLQRPSTVPDLPGNRSQESFFKSNNNNHTSQDDNGYTNKRSGSADNNFLQTLNNHVPKRFITDTSSSQAGSLLLDPSTVTNNPFISMMTSQNLLLPSDYGVKNEIKVQNLTKSEGINVITQQIKQNRSKIIGEKKKLEKKLYLIEEQRKQMIDEFKTKHSKESVKTLLASLGEKGAQPTPHAGTVEA